MCAYVATGVWHHWRAPVDRSFVDDLWPTVERALDWVLSLRRHDGLSLWAIEADGTRPWDYALLTGTSSIQHALRCGAAARRRSSVADARLGRAADAMMRRSIVDHPEALRAEGPLGDGLVLPGARPAPSTGEAAKARLADGWDDVRDGGSRRALRRATSRG